ncbi:MAG: hypothetical protein COC06_09905 [Bacteroidales bacterium]|nr:MAG: hypothetical protein COC06_09905 [Bacteroidales bacterium]
MRNIRTLYLLIFVLVIQVLTIFLLTKKNERLKSLTALKLNSDSIRISKLKKNLELMYQFSAENINVNQNLISENRDTVSFRDVIKKDYVFVIRFAEFNCLTCVSSEIKLLKENICDINQVICISSYKRYEDMIKVKRILDIPIKIYNTTDVFFIEEQKSNELPCCFLIDKNLNVHHFFILAPREKDYNSKYYNYIFTEYLNSD